jgi:hypothetical protein
MGLLSMNPAMTYDKTTMIGKMKYVYVIMGNMEIYKYDLGYGHTTTLYASSSTIQPKCDNTYLKDNYDPSWYNKENNRNFECSNPLLNLTNVHHGH